MDPNQPNGPRIDVTRDGPYRVRGRLPLREQWIVVDDAGDSIDYRDGVIFDVPAEYELCRCGRSDTKPFCDRTHCSVGFDGTETASRDPYLDRARTFEGPAMDLTDAEDLCATGRFCDPEGGIWNLIPKTDDPAARELVAREAGHCPSGRLVAWARATRSPLEPAFEPSLGLIEDTAAGVHGPIWVRGGVRLVSADGETYETRNRMTLCRCGRSGNKPFCDGSHVATERQGTP
jgi:CDGSH-type Zn-finger protein